MIFDLKKKEGVKFDFPGGGWVELKTPTIDDYLRIRKECVENKPFAYEKEGRPLQILNHEIVDNIKQAYMLNDCSIVNWGDFFDKNKTEIPCNAENKNLLMRMDDPTFRDFVNEKLKALIETEQVKKGAELPNS